MTLKKYRRAIAAAGLLLIAAVVTFTVVSFTQTKLSTEAQLTTNLWHAYLKQQWQTEGRTISNPQGSITTSESQSYTMLRAVWENDPSVFSTTWNWTKKNLQQTNGLFAWEWGKNPNGTYGIMVANGGEHTASDADSDIALALITAGNRWHNQAYISEGSAVAGAIWQNEVVPIKGLYYLAADNLEKTASTPYIVINPSYFAPYSYTIFAKYDKSNPWGTLASDSLSELASISKANLNTKASDGLPPDWAIVYRASGVLAADPSRRLDTNFGYNAIRSVWRVALDWEWFKNPQAKKLLSSYSFLYHAWKSKHQLKAVYSHSGKPLEDYGSYAMYGATLPYFQIFHPSSATTIYKDQIIEPLMGHGSTLRQQVNYYDNNWLWFGVSLYDHALPNYSGVN